MECASPVLRGGPSCIYHHNVPVGSALPWSMPSAVKYCITALVQIMHLIHSLLSVKKAQPYSKTMSWLRCLLTICCSGLPSPASRGHVLQRTGLARHSNSKHPSCIYYGDYTTIGIKHCKVVLYQLLQPAELFRASKAKRHWISRRRRIMCCLIAQLQGAECTV